MKLDKELEDKMEEQEMALINYTKDVNVKVPEVVRNHAVNVGGIFRYLCNDGVSGDPGTISHLFIELINNTYRAGYIDGMKVGGPTAGPTA